MNGRWELELTAPAQVEIRGFDDGRVLIRAWGGIDVAVLLPAGTVWYLPEPPPPADGPPADPDGDADSEDLPADVTPPPPGEELADEPDLLLDLVDADPAPADPPPADPPPAPPGDLPHSSPGPASADLPRRPGPPPAPAGPRPLSPPSSFVSCGTPAGWLQHARRGERPCRSCDDAMTRARAGRAAAEGGAARAG